MFHTTITTAAGLEAVLETLRDAPWVALDTEFISEGRSIPELCLVQVATDRLLALIDAPAIGERKMKSLWQTLAGDSTSSSHKTEHKTEIVVHAFRSEMDFFYQAIGRVPDNVFDVQLAAGMIGYDYPAGFGSLLEHFLHITIPKGEARTDWLRRPLAPRQIEYALNDVRYLGQLMNRLKQLLRHQHREHWFHEEQKNACHQLESKLENPAWRSVAKSGGLQQRELAILRAVWLWRHQFAKKRKVPFQRVLRDDILLEIAKRRVDTVERLKDIRGVPKSHDLVVLEDIVAVVWSALELPETELPPLAAAKRVPTYQLQSQLLMTALHWVSRKRHIASQLVGTATDVRELIAATFGTLPVGIQPRLAIGWRAEAIGNFLTDILQGKIAIRLRPENDDPLEFTSCSGGGVIRSVES